METTHEAGMPERTCQEPPTQPKAPNPSADPGVVPDISALSIRNETDTPAIGDFVVAELDPQVAMRILCKGIQALADLTGDIPPTPPASARLRDSSGTAFLRAQGSNLRPVTPPSSVPSHDIRSPNFKNIPIGSPEALLTEPFLLSAEPTLSTRAQYDAIARKFFSRKPAPVSIEEYLKRLHRYCPMSTGVYLAAGVYILRLTTEDRAIPVTPRTAHRLILTSLRVAMKALEDLSYPHERFAGVGGVSQAELAKLEISLCYLLDWELKVDNALLYEKTKSLQQIAAQGNLERVTLVPQLPSLRDIMARRRTVT